MPELFDRRYLLKVGTIGVSALRIRFTVKRTLKPEPNTLELEITNPNAALRAALKEGTPIQLDAGYASGVSTIFLGTFRTGFVHRDGAGGVDVIAKITAGDGEAALRTARVSATLPKGGANPTDVFGTVAKSLGIKSGNLDAIASKVDSVFKAKFAKLGKTGAVLSGSAPRVMQAVTRSVGLEWSVQSDKLQVLERGKALDGTALEVSQKTGLIGYPTLEIKGKTAGRCKFKCLLAGDVIPGRLVRLTSEFVSGNFRIESVTSAGEYAPGAQDWTHDVEGSPY
jgi:hypothetical protein